MAGNCCGIMEIVAGDSDYHGWDNKISVGSFGIDANYLNNFTKLLN